MQAKTNNAVPEEFMRNADYRKYTTPFIYDDEQWVQLSQVYPFVSDYYWASNKGRIYSDKMKICLLADYNQNKYSSVVLTCKEGLSRRIPVKDIFFRCFNM